MNSIKHLGLFAKFWQPGKVKTRLATVLGDNVASEVYFEFLNHLLEQLANAGDRRAVAYLPAEHDQSFRELCGKKWSLTLQSDGGLGTKMRTFFDSMVGESEDENGRLNRVVLIGSDCPRISSGLIEEAFERLESQPVVLGPSTDGGYYLVGMREKQLGMFDDIAWSTSAVLQQTIDYLNANQIGYELLPEMTDIDQWDDLQTLMITLSESSDPVDHELHQQLKKAIPDC